MGWSRVVSASEENTWRFCQSCCRSHCYCKKGEPPAQNVLQSSYDGNIGKLMISFTWRGRTSQDEKLTEAYGCRYVSLRRDLREDPLNLYRLENGRWIPCDPPDPIKDFARHITRYPQFFKPLFELIGKRDNGTWVEIQTDNNTAL